MKFWSVTITNYEDDYKHRYDSGVYRKKPKMFKTKHEAEQYINEYISDHIQELWECRDQMLDKDDDEYLGNDFMNENFEPWTKDMENWPIIKKSIRENYERMTELYEQLCKGEFVDYDFDWVLSEHEIN